MNPRELRKQESKLLDKIEKWAMENVPQPVFDVEDIFTDGLYTRVTKVPAGIEFTSEVHKKQHTFFLMMGSLTMRNVATGEEITLKAPFWGVTEPKTRRLVKTHEDVIFITSHVTDLKDVKSIGDEILVQRKGFGSQYKQRAINETTNI